MTQLAQKNFFMLHWPGYHKTNISIKVKFLRVIFLKNTINTWNARFYQKYFCCIILDLSSSFNGTNNLCPRYSWWISTKKDEKNCHGNIHRWICHISYEDLSHVFQNGKNCFFLNKLDTKTSLKVLACMHHALTQNIT